MCWIINAMFIWYNMVSKTSIYHWYNHVCWTINIHIHQLLASIYHQSLTIFENRPMSVSDVWLSQYLPAPSSKKGWSLGHVNLFHFDCWWLITCRLGKPNQFIKTNISFVCSEYCLGQCETRSLWGTDIHLSICLPMFTHMFVHLFRYLYIVTSTCKWPFSET